MANKILAIDVGEKRVGFAISDELKITARPLFTLSIEETFEAVKKITEEEEIEAVIVGIPRRLDGKFSEKAEFINDFVNKLKERLPNLSVEYEDESGTSALAEERLTKRGVNFRKEKGFVDMEAAAIILESYLSKI